MKKLKWILTTCAALTLCAGAVAFTACGEDEGGIKNHEHVWDTNYVIKTAATCTQEGERYHKCLVAGCTATSEPEVVPKKPHTYGPEKNTATCTEPGNMVQECTVCGDKKIGAATEATGHNMIYDKIYAEATCYQEGDADMKCSKCDYREEHVKSPMTEHAWAKNPNLSVAATCEKPGKNYFDCVTQGCTAHKEEEVAAKGHTPVYDSLVYPTFEKAGSCVGKCSVCQEDFSKNMPRLEEGMEIEFTFKAVRTNGQPIITTHNIQIEVKDSEGNVVKTAGERDLKFGELQLKLPVHQGKNYTATVSGLGSYLEGSVEVAPEHPVGEIKLKSKGLYEIGAENIPAKLGQGNLAMDFSLKDIDGNTIHLKELVQQNKVVMLHFFYTTCMWCNREYPGYIKAFNEYVDKGVAAIGIAPTDPLAFPNNSVEELRTEVAKYRIPFPIVQDNAEVGGYLYQRFSGIAGAPATVFIDHEGVIIKIQIGYLSTDPYTDQQGQYTDVAYKELLKEYTAGEWEDMSSQNIFPDELSDCDYILPGKEE